MRTPDGGAHSFIEDPDIVVLLERRHDAPHHYRALRFTRFFYLHYLKAPRERGTCNITRLN